MRRFAPKPRVSKQQSWLSDSRVCFFPTLSAQDLTIRIHKDLRTGNQEDNIQFSPFQTYNKPCTCKGVEAGRGAWKGEFQGPNPLLGEGDGPHKQPAYERTRWVQYRERGPEGTQRKKKYFQPGKGNGQAIGHG